MKDEKPKPSKREQDEILLENFRKRRAKAYEEYKLLDKYVQKLKKKLGK